MKIGALFAGYGGLEMGVQSVLGGQVAWHSDICRDPSDGKGAHMAPHGSPCSILAHHNPDVPNLGDVTQVDWSQVEPVDVITGGSPCQDVSAAGKRAGMRAGTRSGLWASMCDAIDIIRPSLVVWENVRGVLSAHADSAVEPCPICVGDERDAHLRALGRVVGDLAELGFDARWTGLRAADVGAPHGRFRVFVVAWPAADAGGQRHGRWEDARAVGRLDRADEGVARERQRAWTVAGDRGGTAPADAFGGGRAGRSHDSVRVEVVRTAAAGSREGAGSWGPYESAVRRWERLTRPAPPPTEPGKTGAPRLSPAFVEWLMGLPAGHVTAVPGVSRNEQLKALGNGVVPQQAAEALRRLLHGVHVAPVEVGGLLPTPTASDGKRTTVSRNAAANHSATTLGLEVARLKDGAA